jgi:protocatechuate 3,4-dioxygenase alpha subunit
VSSPPQDRRATRIATREENGALLWDIRLQGDGETVLLSIPGA